MNFKDYFSTQSVDYAKYRPGYPVELFEYLAAIAPQPGTAWDCATGNGQAALALASYFARVVATDGSQAQLDNAARHERITYQQATAEDSHLESHSIDLVTVAQALHWFNLARFYAEVSRVLKPRGVLAVWCYNLLEISPALDGVINKFYAETVGPYWPPERRLIEDNYRSIAFPFAEVEPPTFDMRARWNLMDLLGYIRTWSATQRFIAARGFDPLPQLADELLALWQRPDEAKPVKWPLYLRAGVVQI
ncbi:MAG TPA: class I SAM-dependent methyltransferase [Pyrinomonadaceae bacterium]|jgi:SAM-dependent methyltransferase|nr:class I SAM-dependent methyltransferase [Pyrinomonadaceae bacterium]